MEGASASVRASDRGTPALLCVTPDPAELEAALDKKRWRVHGENYERVEERLRKACSDVQNTLTQLIGAMRDLELWQATAAKTCELPTNSLAKITVITSKMIRSRSVLTSQLGSLQGVCSCFFPSTMLLEITGQRELQARAEVEIEKWANLAFSGQQNARREFRTLHAALRWYRLASQLTDRFEEDLHRTRVRKLRARIGDLERRVRGLKGQLTWEKKRADRAFGALHINRKLARGLAPSDFETLPQEARKTGKTTRGWASARGVDTKAPKEKGPLTARSDGVKSLEVEEAEDCDKENDPQLPVTKEDFASAVASLAARIREATKGRMGGSELTVPLAGIGGEQEMDQSVPSNETTEAATSMTLPSSSEDALQLVENLGGRDLESGPPGPSEPTRSASPVLGISKQGVFIPSLNLKQILEEESSSESTLGNPSTIENPDLSTSTTSLSTNPLLNQAPVTSEKLSAEGNSLLGKLPRLAFPEKVGSQQIKGLLAQTGVIGKLPPLDQSQIPPLKLPVLPSEPSKLATDGAALTERLARALGVDFKSKKIEVETKDALPTTASSRDSKTHEKSLESFSGHVSSILRSSEDKNGQSAERNSTAVSTALAAARSKSTAPERPGSLTERGTASTSVSEESYSKREVLSMKIEQGRQMQHLQTLYEERIQGLHEFYEKLLSEPAVLAQLAGSSFEAARGLSRSASRAVSSSRDSTRGAIEANRGVTNSLDSPQGISEAEDKTPDSTPRRSTSKAQSLVAASLDMPRKASLWKQASRNVRRATVMI